MTYTETRSPGANDSLPAYGIAGLLVVSGVGHFVLPARFDSVMPKELPGPARFYTYASGLVEVAIGGLLLLRGTRRAGGVAAAVFLLLITPVIANGVRLASGRGWPTLLVAIARLPLQVFLIKQAFRVVRTSR